MIMNVLVFDLRKMEVAKYSSGKEGVISIDLNSKMLQWYVATHYDNLRKRNVALWPW